MASAFEAAAALISIVGKSCGLQDLRPIVNVEGGSSSVVLPPLRHPDAEATDEERPRLGDESQRSMCRNPRLLMRSFLRREKDRERVKSKEEEGPSPSATAGGHALAFVMTLCGPQSILALEKKFLKTISCPRNDVALGLMTTYRPAKALSRTCLMRMLN